MNKIKSIDLLNIINKYLLYLNEKNFRFSNDGWPIFDKEMFLNEIPSLIIPYYHRNDKIVANKNKTVICFYMKDKYLLQRYNKLFDEIDIYKNYMGVASCDLSVTFDMDIEMQRYIMLLNQLFIAVLAVNGIKILLNIRCGNVDSINCFKYIP